MNSKDKAKASRELPTKQGKFKMDQKIFKEADKISTKVNILSYKIHQYIQYIKTFNVLFMW